MCLFFLDHEVPIVLFSRLLYLGDKMVDMKLAEIMVDSAVLFM